MHIHVKYMVDSLIFFGNQFSWNLWVLWDQEFKYSTNKKFSRGMYTNFAKTMK